MRRVDHLLRATARAEARHFWFRGFRWFVTPLLDRPLRGRVRRRASSIAAAAPAPTSSCSSASARAYGFDLSEVGLDIGRELGRRGWPAPR